MFYVSWMWLVVPLRTECCNRTFERELIGLVRSEKPSYVDFPFMFGFAGRDLAGLKGVDVSVLWLWPHLLSLNSCQAPTHGSRCVLSSHGRRTRQIDGYPFLLFRFEGMRGLRTSDVKCLSQRSLPMHCLSIRPSVAACRCADLHTNTLDVACLVRRTFDVVVSSSSHVQFISPFQVVSIYIPNAKNRDRCGDYFSRHDTRTRASWSPCHT